VIPVFRSRFEEESTDNIQQELDAISQEAATWKVRASILRKIPCTPVSRTKGDSALGNIFRNGFTWGETLFILCILHYCVDNGTMAA